MRDRNSAVLLPGDRVRVYPLAADRVTPRGSVGRAAC
jgi:hypothetical protein